MQLKTPYCSNSKKQTISRPQIFLILKKTLKIPRNWQKPLKIYDFSVMFQQITDKN